MDRSARRQRPTRGTTSGHFVGSDPHVADYLCGSLPSSLWEGHSGREPDTRHLPRSGERTLGAWREGTRAPPALGRGRQAGSWLRGAAQRLDAVLSPQMRATAKASRRAALARRARAIEGRAYQAYGIAVKDNLISAELLNGKISFSLLNNLAIGRRFNLSHPCGGTRNLSGPCASLLAAQRLQVETGS